MTRVDLRFESAPGLATTVYEACAARVAAEPRRPYLGMSSIGDDCERSLWYGFHGYERKPVTGRVARVFAMGNAVEDRVVADLREAGFVIDGQQLEFVDFEGRFRGHCDGVIHGISRRPHILEIKSANEAGFMKFLQNGIASNPKYMAQVQCYMGYSGLQRALFVVENKNNQELFFERVHFDPGAFEALREKAWRILTAATEPPMAESECHWCDYKAVCV
jgi:hypothetical protein